MICHIEFNDVVSKTKNADRQTDATVLRQRQREPYRQAKYLPDLQNNRTDI
jgi:hypothetical protein